MKFLARTRLLDAEGILKASAAVAAAAEKPQQGVRGEGGRRHAEL
jgi:hypothetical protein